MNHETMRATIGHVPLFSGLGQDEIDLLLRAGVKKSFPKNTLLMSEGSRGESLYVVQQGKVKVFLCDPDGKEVILSILGPGDFIGEMALIDDEPRSAGVMTMEAVEFFIISKADFRNCLAKDPELAANLVKGLCQRLRAADRHIESLALMDVYGRVARTLLQLAEHADGRLVINQRLTHKDIGNMVGASREMVSRIFRDLVNAGYIRVEDRRIIVNDILPANT